MLINGISMLAVAAAFSGLALGPIFPVVVLIGIGLIMGLLAFSRYLLAKSEFSKTANELDNLKMVRRDYLTSVEIANRSLELMNLPGIKKTEEANPSLLRFAKFASFASFGSGTCDVITPAAAPLGSASSSSADLGVWSGTVSTQTQQCGVATSTICPHRMKDQRLRQALLFLKLPTPSNITARPPVLASTLDGKEEKTSSAPVNVSVSTTSGSVPVMTANSL